MLMPSEPSSATVLGRVADCTVEDFRAAIDAAHLAQQDYADSTTGAERGAFLRRWCSLILENVNDCESPSLPRPL